MAGLIKKGNGSRAKRVKNRHTPAKQETARTTDYDSIYGYLVEPKPVVAKTRPITPIPVVTVVAPILNSESPQERLHERYCKACECKTDHNEVKNDQDRWVSTCLVCSLTFEVITKHIRSCFGECKRPTNHASFTNATGEKMTNCMVCGFTRRIMPKRIQYNVGRNALRKYEYVKRTTQGERHNALNKCLSTVGTNRRNHHCWSRWYVIQSRIQHRQRLPFVGSVVDVSHADMKPLV